MADGAMVKGPVPGWIADMFERIDSKDLKGASAYFTDDCDSYFTHFHCYPGGATPRASRPSW
jgi:hypothetical protein